MRSEHCAFAVVLGGKRCIADCHYNWESVFEQDCVGNTRLSDGSSKEDGREYRLGGRLRRNESRTTQNPQL